MTAVADKSSDSADRKIAVIGSEMCFETIKTKRSMFFCIAVLTNVLTAQPEDSSINVMSYNIYRGGTMRGQPLSQTAKVIQEAKADIVGVQETRSPRGVNGEQLAQLLGWNHHLDRRTKCILTRFTIVERLNGGIKVQLNSGEEAYVFNLHLPSNPYQPYQLLSIRPK